ncbi:MAG TPA: hypothetical protein VK716_09355 [Terracidiphilus sp.]|jgi:hypothetical protein|nr:hypothetical protein [Terracidiphilus sp.]
MASSKTQPTFSLRLPNSTREEAEKLARHLGVALDDLILAAVDERIARLKAMLGRPANIYPKPN